MTKTLLAALCTAAMTLPASTAYAVQSPEIAAAADTAFDRRAAELVDLLAAQIPFADYFDPSFQTAIPEAQFKAITASLIAHLMRTAGIDHVVTVDLHTPQIEGFFHCPVDSLTAVPALCQTARFSRARMRGAIANSWTRAASMPSSR